MNLPVRRIAKRDRFMDYAAALLAPLALLIVLAAGWFMTLLSLPGNWLMVLGAALYALLVPDPWRVDVSWIAVGVVLAVAVLGEVLETLAVAMGTSRAGAASDPPCWVCAGRSEEAWWAHW